MSRENEEIIIFAVILITLIFLGGFFVGFAAKKPTPNPIPSYIVNSSINFATSIFNRYNISLITTWQDCYWLDCPSNDKSTCYYYCLYWGEKREGNKKYYYLLDFYCDPKTKACGILPRLFRGERFLNTELPDQSAEVESIEVASASPPTFLHPFVQLASVRFEVR